MHLASEYTDQARRLAPGRFTKVSLHNEAGEIEARLSEGGNWELRIRRDEEASWRLACSGDFESGTMTAEPAGPVRGDVRRLGPLEIDPVARRAYVHGTDIELAKKEFALLMALSAAPDRVFSKEELMRSVWGQEVTPASRTLDSHASRLRRKLRAAGADALVINCWAVGYRLWDRGDLTSFPSLSPVGEAV
jgi:DNA-binding response OmpR family regulator